MAGRSAGDILDRAPKVDRGGWTFARGAGQHSVGGAGNGVPETTLTDYGTMSNFQQNLKERSKSQAELSEYYRQVKEFGLPTGNEEHVYDYIDKLFGEQKGWSERGPVPFESPTDLIMPRDYPAERMSASVSNPQSNNAQNIHVTVSGTANVKFNHAAFKSDVVDLVEEYAGNRYVNAAK